MRQYREWFVGGPLDGQDKREEFPDIPTWGEIRATESLGDIETLDSPESRPLNMEWCYRQDRFTFGGLVIPFWTDHRLIANQVIGMRLAEIIMEPHEYEEPHENGRQQTETEGAPQ